MKQLKKLLVIIPFSVISFATAQYIENAEPINVFLESIKVKNTLII